ncbi:MAG: thiamine-phosphate kinase [Pseudomonadota bacterium]
MSTEFELIESIRRWVDALELNHGVVLGIGDDAAVLQPARGMQLVTTVDALVEGRHFDQRVPTDSIGHMALAVNLSDLAAMGATPRWSLLSLTLPSSDHDWLEAFMRGYLGLSQTHRCALVGGNITRGPLNIAVTAMGEVVEHQWRGRCGAQPGDRIVVTGTLGDAAAALKYDRPELRRRWQQPTPRVAEGQVLAPSARCMTDVSDGLLADLHHLLGAYGAEIDLTALPTAAALAEQLSDTARWPLQLNGGSEYELLAIVPPEVSLPARIGDVPLTVIGRVSQGTGIQAIEPDGRRRALTATGWDHFK